MQLENKFYMPGYEVDPLNPESKVCHITCRIERSLFLELAQESKELGITLSENIRKKIRGEN